jgi:YhcH/YjgK/YiaL family protein
MIIDSIKNHTLYHYGELWAKAFDFLRTLESDIEDGKNIIDVDNLFAGIDRYATKARTDAKLETHQRYIDIQVLLSGTECLEIFPKDELTVREPYDPDKDAEFYEVPDTAPVRITLRPGQFAVFFPEDAHMPCLNAGDTSGPVTKVVIKLLTDRLN